MSSADTAPRTRPKDRKQQILVTARDLFVELGYQHVTMRLIAERLGIQAGALYRHYANKAELFDAVVRDSFADLVPPSAAMPLAASLAESTEAVLSRPYLGALWSQQARFLPTETYEMVRNLLRRFTRDYADRLRTERPELTDRQAELLAWGIQSVMAGPGRSAARLSTADMGRVVLGAALALCAAPMTSPDPDAPTRPQSSLQPVSRRERLLLGAMRLFAERGYQDTAMADIGAVADVSGPSLYAHFDSKAALLLAGIERGTHMLWAGLDEALREHADPADALAAVVAGYVHRSRDWSGIALPVGGETAIEETARVRQREYVAEWVGLLQQSRPELDSAVARVLVRIALSMIDDLCRTPHLVDGAFETNVAAMARALLTSRAAPA